MDHSSRVVVLGITPELQIQSEKQRFNFEDITQHAKIEYYSAFEIKKDLPASISINNILQSLEGIGFSVSQTKETVTEKVLVAENEEYGTTTWKNVEVDKLQPAQFNLLHFTNYDTPQQTTTNIISITEEAKVEGETGQLEDAEHPEGVEQESVQQNKVFNININNNKITNATDPTDLQDVATKNYVDNSITTATAGIDLSSYVTHNDLITSSYVTEPQLEALRNAILNEINNQQQNAQPNIKYTFTKIGKDGVDFTYDAQTSLFVVNKSENLIFHYVKGSTVVTSALDEHTNPLDIYVSGNGYEWHLLDFNTSSGSVDFYNALRLDVTTSTTALMPTLWSNGLETFFSYAIVTPTSTYAKHWKLEINKTENVVSDTIDYTLTVSETHFFNNNEPTDNIYLFNDSIMHPIVVPYEGNKFVTIFSNNNDDYTVAYGTTDKTINYIVTSKTSTDKPYSAYYNSLDKKVYVFTHEYVYYINFSSSKLGTGLTFPTGVISACITSNNGFFIIQQNDPIPKYFMPPNETPDTPLTSPVFADLTEENYNSILFCNASYGRTLVVKDATIFMTNDEGATWRQVEQIYSGRIFKTILSFNDRVIIITSNSRNKSFQSLVYE